METSNIENLNNYRIENELDKIIDKLEYAQRLGDEIDIDELIHSLSKVSIMANEERCKIWALKELAFTLANKF
jgi:hypothetical protein